MEILLAFDGGEVTGVVEGVGGTPLLGAAVFLYPKSETKCDCSKMASTDQNGRYQLRGIAPGEYLLFAVHAADLEKSWGKDFRKQHEAQSTTLTVNLAARQA
jgi:hypothetical protein